MADFLQAVRWMVEGKKVWRKNTDKVFHKTALVCMMDQDGNDFRVSNTLWYLADDWEIHPSSSPSSTLDKVAVLKSMIDDVFSEVGE